ncbi:unnamed protein product [Sympodiomycopsis kandeliae]
MSTINIDDNYSVATQSGHVPQPSGMDLDPLAQPIDMQAIPLDLLPLSDDDFAEIDNALLTIDERSDQPDINTAPHPPAAPRSLGPSEINTTSPTSTVSDSLTNRSTSSLNDSPPTSTASVSPLNIPPCKPTQTAPGPAQHTLQQSRPQYQWFYTARTSKHPLWSSEDCIYYPLVFLSITTNWHIAGRKRIQADVHEGDESQQLHVLPLQIGPGAKPLEISNLDGMLKVHVQGGVISVTQNYDATHPENRRRPMTTRYIAANGSTRPPSVLVIHEPAGVFEINGNELCHYKPEPLLPGLQGYPPASIVIYNHSTAAAMSNQDNHLEVTYQPGFQSKVDEEPKEDQPEVTNLRGGRKQATSTRGGKKVTPARGGKRTYASRGGKKVTASRGGRKV